jgi:putative copper resistance protein D
MPDVLSVILRALSFVLLFQVSGTAFFTAAFGPPLTHSLGSIRRLTHVAAVVALVATIGWYALEPARMAGELSGTFDGSLQKLVWRSSTGASFLLRALGLVLLAMGLRANSLTANGLRERAGPSTSAMSIAGAVIALVSFLVTGHTSMHPPTEALRWLLALLLLVHLVVVAYWFGALWPLYLVTQREPSRTAAQVVEKFSTVAVWLVPLILVAGTGLAVILVPGLRVFTEPYGELLLTKIVLFATLMGFAALNKWRLGPAVARGESTGLRRSLIAEYALITCVLAVTATMTSLFSPE